MKTLFTFLLTAAITSAYCQCDDVDPYFGTNGFVKTNADKANFFFDVGKAAALQQDGKIIVSGTFSNHKRPEILRYMPDGRIDHTFGQDGIVGLDSFKVGYEEYSYWTKWLDYTSIAAIAVQPDGKIVVSGNIGGIEGPFVARFLPNGTLDASFGDKGVFTDQEFCGSCNVRAMVLQPDGKLLLTGSLINGMLDIYNMDDGSVIFRLQADGSIDKSFGKKGKIAPDDFFMFECSGARNNEAIAVQPDGKIVTTGNGCRNTVISRYHADGTPDLSFGNGGMVETGDENGMDEGMQSILVQPDGKIVVGGYSTLKYHGYVMTVMRYTPGGALDPYFGKGGKVSVSFKGPVNRENCKTLLQGDGKIILAGSVQVKNSKSMGDFALCRINEDGSIDSSFGIDGRQVLTTTDVDEDLHTALLQPDGKVVLVGYSWYYGDVTSAVLSRYYTGGVQPPLVASLRQHQRTITINWNGLKDKNINYYSIQHSTETYGFAEKGTLSGADNSALREYSYPIAAPGLYRIVAVGKTGQKSFSNTLTVHSADLTPAAAIFPNPAKDYLHVYGLNRDEQLTISIVNGTGAVLASEVSRGNNQYRTKVSHLPSGTYYVRILGGQKITNLSFVKTD